MDRGSEKVAYYCSELSSRTNTDATNQNTSNNNNNNSNNNNNASNNSNNNNNNNIIGKLNASNEQHHPEGSNSDIQSQMNGPQQQLHQLHNNDAQSTTTSGGDYPSRTINRYNSNQTMAEQPHGHAQFVQGQAIAAPQQQQPISQSQPQYLISNSNPQHLTNLNPHHFNQHQSTNSGHFPNQLHSANYHVNSNHLYQAGIPQQQQTRALFQQQHHKSPSMGDDGHLKMSNNQVIFHENTKQHLSPRDLDLQRRQHQHINNQQQIESTPVSAGLTTSQSMNHNEFARQRRKSEHLGLTSEVGDLKSLDLGFESMLMPDGPKSANNQLLQKQHQAIGQNIDKQFLRPFANQQGFNDNERPNNGSDRSLTGYDMQNQSNIDNSTRNSLFMTDNRSEDNIYEEIDMSAMRLHAEYQIDSNSDTWKKKNSKKFLSASFTRWFSTRKKSSNSQNSDQEENPSVNSSILTKRPQIISLPEQVPDNLTPEKHKRRLIVSSIIDSENSYTSSLYRLIYEYKKPLEEADPPILSANKIGVIFFCLDQILQFHKLFGLSLRQNVQEWDKRELIGSVFTNNFSKPVVLDIYSGFINNFTNAMETAKRASKSKAFAQFVHDKSIASPDRLSFFGSMVKPVQRFPQFILLLSDLLKHTPFNHPDRMPLQRALTELESLADRLNERKRDAERHFAVKQLLKDHLNESDAHSQRFLLRQDETCLLDMDPSTNTILKSKTRKMYLLNDMLICVSTPSNRLKFAVPLSEITVVESITPAISDLLAHSNFRNPSENPNVAQHYSIEQMEIERQSLEHDLKIMMGIAASVAILRYQYNGLNPAAPEQICLGIRDEIHKKEFQMTLIDRSCLQLRLNSKNNKEILVIQFENPDLKRDWLIDVRLTKLALDRANNPGWENVTANPPPTHQASLCSIGQRVPLFVKSLAIFKSDQSQLTCALHYYLRQAPFIGENPAGVLWICNVNAGASSLGALATNGAEISLIHSYELSESHVTCLESVGSTLWIGLRQGRIIVIDANSPSAWVQFASLDVQNEVTCIKYFGHFVYVGLINGVVAVFDAINFDKPYLIQLSQSPVTCLLPINEEIFVCSHNKIWRIKETTVVDNLTVQNGNILSLEEESIRPNLLAHCGSGIWVSILDSPIVKLYHAESLEHLVDIDVGTSIRRVLNDFKGELKITVTSMMATRGLLWIGTNVGMIATLTLPRLQGVPLLSGSTNIALHRFLGPVNIMLNLSAGSECVPQLPFNNRNQQHMKPNHFVKNEDAEAIYGQYEDLMNVDKYITSSRKSGGFGETPATSMAWEFPNQVNLSGMNISDDSGSSASSCAIYREGVPRGMKQVQNKAVVSNQATLPNANQHLPSQVAVAAASVAHQHAQQTAAVSLAAQNQLISNNACQAPPNQINQDLNHIYDKAQSQQSVTYNQGSLNGAAIQAAQPGAQPSIANSDASVVDQQRQQRQILSVSQSQLAINQIDQIPSSQDDYGSQAGTNIQNKLYDQPAQLIQQQQQIIQQSRQALNQMDGNMINNMQPTSTSNYGTIGGKMKNFSGNKTVLVLAGGNGYQRMAMGDNKPFSEHAHCIIWEYKG